MVAMAASPTAWSPVYESAADTDDTRVPEVSESLLTVIAGITGPLSLTNSSFSLFC